MQTKQRSTAVKVSVGFVVITAGLVLVIGLVVIAAQLTSTTP